MEKNISKRFLYYYSINDIADTYFKLNKGLK